MSTRRDARRLESTYGRPSRWIETLLSVPVQLLLLLFLPLLALLRLGWSLLPIAIFFGITSMLTFSMYYIDKQRASGDSDHTRRISEATLHVLALCGGWPGALVGQQVLRHKSGKLTFRIVFWCIVILHEAAALEVLNGREGIPRLLALLSRQI